MVELLLSLFQELNNAEVAHRIKDAAASLQHDFSASMEYFSRLVYSFETRMNCYRKEIEELETFLSTSTPRTDFTPQGKPITICITIFIFRCKPDFTWLFFKFK